MFREVRHRISKKSVVKTLLNIFLTVKTEWLNVIVVAIIIIIIIVIIIIIIIIIINLFNVDMNITI